MRKRTTTNQTSARLLSLQEISAYLGIGSSTARKFCTKCGAVHQIGSRTLYDRLVVDQHLNAEASVSLYTNDTKTQQSRSAVKHESSV